MGAPYIPKFDVNEIVIFSLIAIQFQFQIEIEISISISIVHSPT